MPALVTITVKPSGGDYTSLNTALAAVASDLTVSDEQVTIECDTFSGGLAEQVDVPTITQDATRYLEIKAASGHEYNPVDDSGFFLTANIGFTGVFVNSNNFTRLHGIGVKNTRTLGSGRGVQWNGNDCVISNVYATTTSSSGASCFLLTNANNLTINNCLSHLGTTGFDFGNNNTRTANKLTSIDASSIGFRTGTANTTITDSLTIGSSDPYSGTFNASSSNNASDSTDAPGTSPFNNRTTADLANYALGDFRTASGSALATGGSVDFIGYDVETGGGGAITVNDQTTNSNTLSNNGAVFAVGAFDVTEQATSTNSLSNSDSVLLTAPVNISDGVTNSNSLSNNDNLIYVGQFIVNDNTSDTTSLTNNDSILLSATVIVNGSVTNSNSLSNGDSVLFTGEFIVQDSITNNATASNNDGVTLGSFVSVSDGVSSSISATNNDSIKLSGEFLIEDAITNSGSASSGDAISLVGAFNISDSISNSNTTSNNDSIQIGAFEFTVYNETNITAKTLLKNITARSYSTNISA